MDSVYKKIWKFFKGLVNTVFFPLFASIIILVCERAFYSPLILTYLNRFHFDFDAILWLSRLILLAKILVFLWFFGRLSNVFYRYLIKYTQENDLRFFEIILRHIKDSLTGFFLVGFANIALPYFELNAYAQNFLSKSLTLGLIGCATWLGFEFTEASEKIILGRYYDHLKESIPARKIYTKTRVLKRFANTLILLLAFAAMMMLFEPMRKLGVSVLASATVLSALVIFAAQQTIGTFISSVQLAITQAVKIGDLVKVENQVGKVEEITFAYVIVELWDLKRLILPTRYFIEKPFENWTHTSSELLAPINLYVDYNVPLEALRAEFQKILEQSKFWDKKVSNVQVTDATENGMQIRALASAADAGKSWELSCEVREKLIKFIRDNFPESLPKSRTITYQGSAVNSGDSSREK